MQGDGVVKQDAGDWMRLGWAVLAMPVMRRDTVIAERHWKERGVRLLIRLDYYRPARDTALAERRHTAPAKPMVAVLPSWPWTRAVEAGPV